MADAAIGDAPGLSQPWMRLLALLPVVTDADLPADAEQRIGAAFRDGAGTVPWLAALAAGGSGGGAARRSGLWGAARWRPDARRGWVNDGGWRVRNPAGPHPLTDAEFVQLREFFVHLGVG